MTVDYAVAPKQPRRALALVLVCSAGLAVGCASAPPPAAAPAEVRTLDVDGPFRHASGLGDDELQAQVRDLVEAIGFP